MDDGQDAAGERSLFSSLQEGPIGGMRMHTHTRPGTSTQIVVGHETELGRFEQHELRRRNESGSRLEVQPAWT